MGQENVDKHLATESKVLMDADVKTLEIAKFGKMMQSLEEVALEKQWLKTKL